MLAEMRELVGDDIEVEFVHQDVGLEDPTSRPARRRHDRRRSRRTTRARRVFPYLLSGGTDNKALARLGIAGYGFAPLRLPADLDFPGDVPRRRRARAARRTILRKKVLRDLLLSY